MKDYEEDTQEYCEWCAEPIEEEMGICWHHLPGPVGRESYYPFCHDKHWEYWLENRRGRYRIRSYWCQHCHHRFDAGQIAEYDYVMDGAHIYCDKECALLRDAKVRLSNLWWME